MRLGTSILFIVPLLAGAVLFTSALEGAKKPVELSFNRTSPNPQKECTPFMVMVEPYPFFSNLKKTAKTRGVEFQRGKTLVQHFPDDLAIEVAVFSGPNACGPPVNDLSEDFLKTLRFSVSSRHGSELRLITGVATSSKESSGPWCENRCSEMWTYRLVIQVGDVPLTDAIILTIATRGGEHIDQFIGQL
jgi:hypothetical protein